MMPDTIGTFRIDIEVENPARPGKRVTLAAVLVDTGADLSWCPSDLLDSLGIERRKVVQFRQADGSVLERWTGPAFIYAAGTTATDDVVFGERSDMMLIGARALEGLNLRVDPVSKRLVDAGPVPAVAAMGLITGRWARASEAGTASRYRPRASLF